MMMENTTTNNKNTNNNNDDVIIVPRNWFCDDNDDASPTRTIHKPISSNGDGSNNSCILARGSFGEVSIGIQTTTTNNSNTTSDDDDDDCCWRFVAVKSIPLVVSNKTSNNPWGGLGLGGSSAGKGNNNNSNGSNSSESYKLSSEIFNEICSLRVLNPHPNIVELIRVYPAGRSVCLALGYCPSDLYTTLEWKRRKATLPLLSMPVIQGIMRDLFSALNHCHCLGVCHLDISPTNLLVSGSGQIRLTDFGLSQPYAASQKEEEEQHAQQQPKGLCTLYYRSPEQLLGNTSVSPAMDIYSAGLVCCELIAGFPIFRGTNVLGQLSATFDVLGTPTKESWPTIEADCPDYGKLQFQSKPSQPLGGVIPRALECPGLLPLLENLVVLNPHQRYTAQQVLQHECLSKTTTSNNQKQLLRSCMRKELIPPQLLPPILLSNPTNNADISIASKQAFQLVTQKRHFMKNLTTWKKYDNNKDDKKEKEEEKKDTTTLSLLQSRCNSLCPNLLLPKTTTT